MSKLTSTIIISIDSETKKCTCSIETIAELKNKTGIDKTELEIDAEEQYLFEKIKATVEGHAEKYGDEFGS